MLPNVNQTASPKRANSCPSKRKQDSASFLWPGKPWATCPLPLLALLQLLSGHIIRDAASGPLHLWLPQSGISIHHERRAGSHPGLCSMSLLLSERGLFIYNNTHPPPHHSLYSFSCVSFSSWKVLFYIVLSHCLFTYFLSQQLDFTQRFLPAGSPWSMPGTYVRQIFVEWTNEWMNIHCVYIFAKKRGRKMT